MNRPHRPPPANPWEALFASVTHPHPALTSLLINDSNVNNDAMVTSVNGESPAISSSAGGYTIFIQHSMTPKSQRQWAFASTMAMTNEHAQTKKHPSLSSHLASMSFISPQSRHKFQGSWYGMSGPFLVRQAFEELCQACDGAVVFVSLLGTSGILDLQCSVENGAWYSDVTGVDESGEGNNYYARTDKFNENGESSNFGNKKPEQLEQRSNVIKKFFRNGAWVDLSSNPLGWEDKEEENNSHPSCFVKKSTMNNLPTLVDAIRQAAASVEIRRSQPQPREETNKIQRMQRPIPVIFETLTPLLSFHGVENVGLMLKCLGAVMLPKFMSSNDILHAPTKSRPAILSPIVAPILYESLRPSEHRLLEDMADAVISLNILDAHDSVSSDANFCTSGASAVVSGVMDLLRRGGGRGAILGGKLIQHCIPFYIMRTPMNISTSSNRWSARDIRDGCYWVLEHHGSHAKDGDGNGEEGGDMGPLTEQSSTRSSDKIDAFSGGDLLGPAGTTTIRSRIYLDDNDPEFDDFDEEDPDDDLDL